MSDGSLETSATVHERYFLFSVLALECTSAGLQQVLEDSETCCGAGFCCASGDFFAEEICDSLMEATRMESEALFYLPLYFKERKKKDHVHGRDLLEAVGTFGIADCPRSRAMVFSRCIRIGVRCPREVR